ncbi:MULTISPECIES: hypothetical protein [unclassified Microcystis]|uniref:hypothetical protein n=1 Tax=unclassified Microcystis TaxID=2643300 RepID=UPI00258B7523|nr:MULTISPECIES: hypothetical protein [unclassified Microcystis]
MAQGNHNELNLYEEAKAGLFSLVQQTVAVFIGFVLMLLVAGGAPSSFVIALSFCLGTAFVAWSEQKRVRNLKAVDSSIPPKESETASIVTEERSNKNSSTLDIQTLRQQRLLEDLKILEEQLMTTSSVPDKFRLREQIRSLKSEIGSFLGGVRLGVEGDYYNVSQATAVGKYRSDNNTFVQLDQKQTLAEAAAEIQRLLKQLEQTNPSVTEAEKVAYVSDETTPSFKRRVVGALQTGGEAAIEEFLDNPYVSVGKAVLKDWMKPK